jgi:hypothetical protein
VSSPLGLDDVIGDGAPAPSRTSSATAAPTPDPLADLMGLFDSAGLDGGPRVNGGGMAGLAVGPGASGGDKDLLGELM